MRPLTHLLGSIERLLLRIHAPGAFALLAQQVPLWSTP